VSKIVQLYIVNISFAFQQFQCAQITSHIRSRPPQKKIRIFYAPRFFSGQTKKKCANYASRYGIIIVIVIIIIIISMASSTYCMQIVPPVCREFFLLLNTTQFMYPPAISRRTAIVTNSVRPIIHVHKCTESNGVNVRTHQSQLNRVRIITPYYSGTSKRRSAVVCLLGLRVRIPPMPWLSLVSVVCCKESFL
jgi:hypothetical protein